MIEVSYHGDLKEVQCDPALTAAIEERALGPFERLEWWQLLQDECGLQPLIVIARDGDDIAILPLQAGNGHLYALGNWYNFWVGLQFSENAALVPRAIELMTAMAKDLHRKAWRVTLAPLRSEGWDTIILTKAFAAAGWVYWNEECDVNWFGCYPWGSFAVPESFDEFLATRPGALRTTLKRKAGKVQTAIHLGFDDSVWDDYEAVYRASWKPDEASFGFLRQFAKSEAAAGRMRLGIATRDGQAVAAQLWTIEAGTAFIHKLAHREDAKSLSPGTTLTAALFRHVFDIDRVACVDFGTGEAAYKRDWLSGCRPRMRLDAFDPIDPRAWPHIARHKLRGLVGVKEHS